MDPPVRGYVRQSADRNDNPESAGRYQYFTDLDKLMEALLAVLEKQVLRSAALWQTGAGERCATLRSAMKEPEEVCHQRSLLIRAIAGAAEQDQRLERAWELLVQAQHSRRGGN